ncbi:MAG: sigma-70 family RNA polymerase sigma factor [Acidimicrobiales bacterium]
MTLPKEAERAQLFDELARTGSEDKRNRIVESYAPLAVYFANRYRDRGVDSDDLLQVAQLALILAVDRFDPSFANQFSTFAGRTIDGELKRHFRDGTWAVRVPRSLKELSGEVRQLSDSLSLDLGRSPTVADLAAASGHDRDTILAALDIAPAYRPASLDAPTGGGDEAAVRAALGAVDARYERTETVMAIQALLATLSDSDREIVELRFFHELSQDEIAARLGVSQMQVSRLLRRSLEHLRAYLR